MEFLTQIGSSFSGLSFSVISSSIAAIFALISFSISRRTEARHAALQSQDLLLKFDEQVRDWGRDAIETIVALEAATYTRNEMEFSHQIARISGMIDQGRLLLPNTPHSNGQDDEKPDAYKGRRPLVLQNLFEIYDHAARLSPADYGAKAAGEIFALRRAFVAELVIALDTKRNKAVLQKLDTSVRKQFTGADQRKNF